MKKYYLIIFLLVVTKVMLFAQDYDTKYNTRTVMINYPDSIIKAKILNTQQDFKIHDDLQYYWYNDDKIGFNRGGYIGKPLHGSYTVCNNEGVLLTQGEFENGLKEGKWKTWYVTGELKSAENFKSGLKHDLQSYYSENGELVKELKYKNGEEVENTEGPFLKSIFKKKDKEEKSVNDSIQTKTEVIEENTDI
ncbi:toxin-antitoxin system YwqK family antitoxin [Bacteroidota bacterium]